MEDQSGGPGPVQQVAPGIETVDVVVGRNRSPQFVGASIRRCERCGQPCRGVTAAAELRHQRPLGGIRRDRLFEVRQGNEGGREPPLIEQGFGIEAPNRRGVHARLDEGIAELVHGADELLAPELRQQACAVLCREAVVAPPQRLYKCSHRGVHVRETCLLDRALDLRHQRLSCSRCGAGAYTAQATPGEPAPASRPRRRDWYSIARTSLCHPSASGRLIHCSRPKRSGISSLGSGLPT